MDLSDLIVFNLDTSPDRFDVVATIIEQEIPDAPSEVKAAIAAYAQGNPGASRLIARQAKSFKTKAQVESFIGWPLSGGFQEAGHEIYDRLKKS
jgi:hypothetical protein